MPALRRQRKANLCEIEANLAYIVSSSPGGVTGRPYLKKTKKKKEYKKLTRYGHTQEIEVENQKFQVILSDSKFEASLYFLRSCLNFLKRRVVVSYELWEFFF